MWCESQWDWVGFVLFDRLGGVDLAGILMAD